MNTVITNTGPNQSGLIDIIASKDGIWNPDLSMNRYRRDMFPDDFFQWWYYAVKNPETQEHWAFCYFINFCPTQPELEGLMFLFSYITPTGKIQMAYKLPLSQMVYEGNYCQFSFGNGMFRQIPLSNNQYRITGLMNNTSNVWTSFSTIEGINETTEFSWDLTLTRIVGCMSQNDFDSLANLLGSADSVLWNSNMFDALVSGSISINGISKIIGSNSRGYADMNWGSNFISKSEDQNDPDKYFWGWLSVCKRNLADPSKDVALIAAYANDKQILGMETGMSAVFASGANIIGKNICWKSVKTQPFGLGVNLIEECSYGSSEDRFVNCYFTADNFITYIDTYGIAQIPTHQIVVLEGEYVRITLDATINPNMVSRLLTPNKAGIWSNFEALGAVCSVKIEQKSYKWYDLGHFCPIYTIYDEFIDNSAGLEYGFCIEGVLP
jgi:hypothetical protein